jgi:hypothetical protein
MPMFLSSRALVALSLLFLTVAARAVVPWTLLVNTNNVINVTNYGANVTNADNATYIQSAINQAAKGGLTNSGGGYGGIVKIPGPGIYLCGPLNMANYVNLQIDTNAVLRMLPIDQYPGTDISPPNFISASSLHDIAISGPGAIDGQGLPWWKDSETNAAANRPRMINFAGCSRHVIQNITLSNSPSFFIAIGGSGGSKTVQGVIIRAPSSSDPVNPSHNTDACDVGGTNILVQNCDISNGDDDFTCGGGTYDVLITNNVYGNGHGVSIGSYTSPGVSNITVINCSFTGTDSGFKVKSMRGRGGLVQNLKYFNITMTNVDWPISFDAHYEYGLGIHTTLTPAFVANDAFTNPAPLIVNSTPIIQNILVSNVTAVLSSTRPPFQIWGLPEALVSNIVFRSVNITSSAPYPPAVYNATNIQFIDCTFNLAAGANTLQLWNAGVIFTNSASSPTVANQWLFDGLTTNLLIYNGSTSNLVGNTLQFYNALGALKNTNALDDGPLTLAASTFTVSNNLSLTPSTILNFVVGTNPATLAVVGNLTLGGTNNLSAGPGFTNGTYTLMTYTGALNGNLPTLNSVPAGYTYAYDTKTAGVVKLIATLNVLPLPATPTNLVAVASNATVALTWSSSATATNYNVKRSTTTGTGYAPLATVAVTNYTDVQVTNGMKYFYVVSALGVTGESTNSAEASATPQSAFIVVTTNVFTDTFGSSTLNGTSVPTTNSTSYDIASTKAATTGSFLTPGSKLRLALNAPTSGGFVEAQALFTTNPVTLATVGDCINLTYTFTNTTGSLLVGAPSSSIFHGLYNSGGNAPVPGYLNNSGLTSNSPSAYGSGYCAGWQGYSSLICSNGNAQIYIRPAQNTAFGTSTRNQDLIGNGFGSGTYTNTAGAVLGSEAIVIGLTSNATYTVSYSIVLTAAGTLTTTNKLYSGTGTGGTLIFSQTNSATGASFLTNSFDGLCIAVRNAGTNGLWGGFNPTMDISKISVAATLSMPTGGAATAVVTLSNLSQTYNGTARSVTASTTPSSLNVLLTYNGSANAPTNVGSYTVIGTVNDPNYVGSATNTLVVGPSLVPPVLGSEVVGHQLQLSWPPDHLGWRLQIQTNSLTTGLATNWTTVPNSTNIVSTNIVINPTNGSVFLRMIYP